MSHNYARWISGSFLPEYAVRQPGINVDGMLADEIVVEEDGVVLLPASLSFEEAATLPCAAVTTWNALTEGGAHCVPVTSCWSLAPVAFRCSRSNSPK